MNHDLHHLIRLDALDERMRQRCELLIRAGALVCINDGDERYVSAAQIDQFRQLHAFDDSACSDAPLFSALFPTDNEVLLWPGTSVVIAGRAGDGDNETVDEVILQLLPAQVVPSAPRSASVASVELPGGAFHVFSQEAGVLNAASALSEKIASTAPRSAAFARSAHYLGSKASLAPAIKEIVRTVLPEGSGTVIDLMCGSGATSGAFAHEWPSCASDAQHFSRLLAKIQGGGFSEERARTLLDSLLPTFRAVYEEIATILTPALAVEEDFLTSEFTDNFKQDFASWVSNYPSLRNPTIDIEQAIAVRRSDPKIMPGLLFSYYYANIFLGVRQCAEIDGLRCAIEKLQDPIEKEWALGALACTVSACADNYGGHFAQPRLKLSDPIDIERKIEKTLLKRSLSITQEFAIRLLSLGAESEKTRYAVDTVSGPWEPALDQCGDSIKGPAVVYLDPPYTRDEYSRYYHVLETLILYNYPPASGPAMVPDKGSLNRFASEFFSRSSEIVGGRIAAVIRKCLHYNWPVLLSYADTGLANMIDILRSIDGHASSVKLYRTAYKHVMHGRKGVKRVNEFVILIEPKKV